MIIKTYKKEYNYLRFTPKMNYFTRLIREMTVKYEGDNTPFLTREETEQMTTMFHVLMIYLLTIVIFREISTQHIV